MARAFPFQTSMAAGELAPEYLMRTDLQARGEGAKRFRNALQLAGGGFKRRWGTEHKAVLNGLARLESIGAGVDDAQILVFGASRFEVRDLDGTLVQAITSSVPWTADDLFTMQVAIENNRIVVASRSFFPRVLTKTGSTWAIAQLSFTSGIDGAVNQPYWRFIDKGVSLSVNGYTGSGRTLTTSAAFFTADHVGAKIRYTGVEISITGVTNGTTATGTIAGSLYPTLTVTVGSSSGFLTGQVVAGDDSQVRGVVAGVPSGSTLTVQLLEGYTAFDDDEKLQGPTATTTVTSTATAASPAATVEWDEQMISTARGYPGACALHRNRLLLGDFPLAQNALAASATGDITDFDTGTGVDTDAVIETIGLETSLGLKHFGSTEQLLMFTENGPYYVPEQVAAPFSPTNYEALQISPEPVGEPSPLMVAEGMLFVERGSGRVMIALPTGNVRRSWDVADLSELGFHLMGVPVEIELLSAGTESERLVCLLRDDGTMAVLTYRRGGQYSAWGLWSTAGSWRSIVSAGGDLFAVCEREINGVTRFHLERFTPTCWGDDMLTLATLATAATPFASGSVGVWDGVSKIGTYALNGSGVLQGVDDSFSAVQIGLDFDLDVETVPPIDPERGLRPTIKITRVDVDCLASVGFKGNGKDPSGWSGGVGGAVGAQTGVRRFRPMGRAKDKTFRIQQTVGGPLEIRSITMEVTS